MNPYFSFVIPVYNRPEEIRELLDSFTGLDYQQSFEIIIVEDGSSEDAKAVVDRYTGELDLKYFYKENSGPGDSRNFGMRHACGEYFIILDSDVLLPPNYLNVVEAFLKTSYVDCYGGADKAHPNFTDLQKAISFVMTSFLTTGGLRGHRSSTRKFEPRSFNMGISRVAFENSGGFGNIHPGEDPDLSLRLQKKGFTTAFIPGAEVYHKRRISWSSFYRQVRKFGLVRPILSQWHPGSGRITFWFPTFFVLFMLLSLLLGILWTVWALLPLLFYLTVLFLEASFRYRSLRIGLLSIAAVFVQFFGYGWAFAYASWQIRVRRKDPRKVFPDLFFV